MLFSITTTAHLSTPCLPTPYGIGITDKHRDRTSIAFSDALWAGLKRVLYPGGFVFAFGSTRTYHPMAVAAEDQGFVIHPMLAWVFGNGFPKATHIDDQTWAGHRYGLQAIKPALEPILVAQKPYKKAPKQSIVAFGAGAYNSGSCIGACAVTLRNQNENEHTEHSKKIIRVTLNPKKRGLESVDTK